MRVKNQTETIFENGVRVIQSKEIWTASRSLFDNSQTADKIRVSNSEKSQSVGLSGFENTSSGTNAVEALKQIDNILGKLSPK
jgi:hypothetical protein